MAHALKGSHLHTPRISPNGMNHTCLAFPAKAGTHLPTPEGWKAELACVAGWLHTEISDIPSLLQFRNCIHPFRLFRS